MIVLIGVIGSTLALLLGGFVADVADTSATKTRAQIAADAAALAAVAESGPYGAGEPERQAAAFAEANGARLVECLCEPGSTAVQVRVAMGDVVADARAIFDPTKLMSSMGAAAQGLHPAVRDAVDRVIAASEGAVSIGSGHRSTQTQSELWANALVRFGDPEVADDWVARPGTSMHERGLAVDLAGDVELAARIVTDLDLPLVRPLDHEPWHFELRLLDIGIPP